MMRDQSYFISSFLGIGDGLVIKSLHKRLLNFKDEKNEWWFYFSSLISFSISHIISSHKIYIWFGRVSSFSPSSWSYERIGRRLHVWWDEMRWRWLILFSIFIHHQMFYWNLPSHKVKDRSSNISFHDRIILKIIIKSNQ